MSDNQTSIFPAQNTKKKFWIHKHLKTLDKSGTKFTAKVNVGCLFVACNDFF